MREMMKGEKAGGHSKPEKFACRPLVSVFTHGHVIALTFIQRTAKTCRLPAMSHSHSHAPGEIHSHSHGPPTPLTPHTPNLPQSDPVLQALIDQDFKPAPIKIGAEPHIAVCEAHSQEKCSDCDLDFTTLNRMSRIFANNPNLPYPPPANVVTQRLTQMVTSTKEEGNVSRLLR